MQKPLQAITLTLVLTAIAALPRLYDLGSLSFFGDEQITAMVSRSVAEGRGPRMPSGMPYLRGLPFSYLAAASSEIFGPENDFSYRLPAALFGVLTVPLFFLLAQGFVGRWPALVASVLLALSEWHIVTSREARFYAPFLFFYIAAVFAVWRWAVREKGPLHLVGPAALFCATVSFHQLGILAVLPALVPLALRGWARSRPSQLVGFAGLGWLAAWFYNETALATFWQWATAHGRVAEDAGGGASLLQLFSGLPGPKLLASLVGAGLGLWVAHASRYEDEARGAALRRIAHYTLAALAGAMTAAGQLHAAAIAGLAVLVMHPEGGVALARRARLPLLLVAAMGVLAAGMAIAGAGPVGGPKALIAFPFPYLAHLGVLFPGLIALFVGECVYLGLARGRPELQPLRASLLAVLAPLTVIGVAKEWGEPRYLLVVYPFLLLVAAAGLVQLASEAGRRTGRWGPRGALLLALVVAASGLLGGHGVSSALRIATAQHGTPQAYRNPFFYPDHAAPGRFVRQHRLPGDVVIAENALRQWWYAGPIDYWLRKPVLDGELFQEPDGTVRDVYLNLVEPTGDVLEALERSPEVRVWMITSAERWEDYSSPEQQRWLRRLEATHEPVFVGRDGVTKVYCMNCGELQPQAS